MSDQQGLGLLDVSVRRNGYGRQAESFEASLKIDGMNGHEFPGVFIRSPIVERTGDVNVIATYQGHPVAVQKDRILALCFHPELTTDLRLHREFVRLAGQHASRFGPPDCSTWHASKRCIAPPISSWAK